MNLATVDRIAKAVLYEGYMLYPYRPSSVKNQQRWNFGVLARNRTAKRSRAVKPGRCRPSAWSEGGSLRRSKCECDFFNWWRVLSGKLVRRWARL